jgi:hypothetical protein
VQQRDVASVMTVVGSYVADSRVKVLGVVPSDETGRPSPCSLQAEEAVARVGGRVLEVAEKRFDEGIVVADAGAAKRWRNTQVMHGRKHGAALHRRAVVGVEHELVCSKRVFGAQID